MGQHLRFSEGQQPQHFSRKTPPRVSSKFHPHPRPGGEHHGSYGMVGTSAPPNISQAPDVDPMEVRTFASAIEVLSVNLAGKLCNVL